MLCDDREMGDGHRGVSVALAAVVGITVMVIVNQLGHGGDLLSLAEYVALKGVVVGSVTAVMVFAVARLMATSLVARSWGLLTAGVLLGAFGLLALVWNLSWGFTPNTLEGAWTWPTAIVPLVLSVLLFRCWRRMRAISSAPEWTQAIRGSRRSP